LLRRARFLALTLVLFAALVATTIGNAADDTSGTLTKDKDPLFWSGSFTGESGDENDLFRLTVELGRDFWRNRPGGVQIGVHWVYSTDDFNDIDLEVVDSNGEVIASSVGGDEDTESVIIPHLANGEYTVRIIPFGISENGVDYTGLAEIEFAPKVKPLRDLLPNMVALKQREVRSGEIFLTGSCTETEIAEDGARKCLRFEQILANVGKGPMELRYRIDPLAEIGAPLPGADDSQLTVLNQPMDQRIYRSDGTWHDRLADHYEFHPAHFHFHYNNFALSKLWQSDATGARLGSEPVEQTKKLGFCLIDVENVWFGLKGDAAHTFKFCPPNPDEPDEVSVNGISLGWADVYNYDLDGQYIEISNVPDGFYLLETIVDPGGTLLETSEADNNVFLHIQLCQGGTAVEIVGGTDNNC
jgi:hypothetical protein